MNTIVNKIFLTVLLSFLIVGDASVRADADGAIIGGVIGGVAGLGLGSALASHDRHQHNRDHNRVVPGKRKRVERADKEPVAKKCKRVEVVQVDDEPEEEVEVVYVRQPRRVVRRVYYEEPEVIYHHVGYAPFCPPVYTHVAYHHPTYVHETHVCHDEYDGGCSPAPLVLGAFGAFTGAMIGSAIGDGN